MANYVLVHGGRVSSDTWNRLAGRDDYPSGIQLGNRYWDGTVAFLNMHNHRVFAPALTDESTGSLREHIEQVCTLIMENALREVILVGHSYGGMVITGVSARIADRLRRLVYLDAALPDPRQSLFDILKIGLLHASKNPELPEPSPPYIDKLPFDPERIEAIPKTYVLCTESEFSDVTGIAKRKIAAEKQGWTYLELPSSHFPMADMPDELHHLLLDAAER